MTKLIRGVFSLALLIAVGGTESRANGFRNPPEGAHALGRTGGKIAHINDATAVSHNPANLVDVTQPEVALSVTLIDSEVKYTSPLGAKAKTDNDMAVLPNLHAAWPLGEGEWVAGVGVTTPYGQHTKWKRDSVFRYSAPYFAELSVLNINPSIATRLGERVAVGAGISVYYSELEIRQDVPWSFLLGAPVPMPDGQVRAIGDGVAVGANIGITAKLTERQHVALTYKSPFDVDYEGDFNLSEIPPPAAGGFAAKSDFDSTIKFPSVVVLGYGLKINDKINVGIDAEWIEFSRYQTLPIDAGVNAAFSSDIPQRWKDIWTFGVGVDWALLAPWTLRAGYIYMESPIPSSSMAPTLPDADRHLLSLGVGYTRNNTTIDFAYAYSFLDDRTISDHPEPAFNGKYELSSQMVQVTCRVAF